MKEFFKLHVRVGQSIPEIVAMDAGGENIATITVAERCFAGGEKEIVFYFRHPKSEKTLTIVPYRGVVGVRDWEGIPRTKEGFLELWPEGKINFIFLFDCAEKMLVKEVPDYIPIAEKSTSLWFR